MKKLIALFTLMATTAHALPPSGGSEREPLPRLLITTDNPINAQKKVDGRMKVYDSGSADAPCSYDGTIGIKWRGNSSLSFDQKKYTLETRDADGHDLDATLLGMPAESDWVLLAPYNDISMLRDVFAFDLWNQMGHWAPRTRLCEVEVNGEYMGIYALSERIKRSPNRVNIAKLKPADTTGRELTGGYIVRIDAFDQDDVTFTSKVKGLQTAQQFGGFPGFGGFGGLPAPGVCTWTVCYPKKKNLQPEQLAYIEDYIDHMEQSFQQENYTDPKQGYAQWIDVASFVDYFIHTELSLNADGFKRSTYFYKDKDQADGTRSKLVAGPVWDYNLAFGNCNFCSAADVEAWVYEGCETNPTPVFWKLLAADPAFMQAVRKRYGELRRTLLSQERIDRFFDSHAALLAEAKDRHFAKYANLFSKPQAAEPSPQGGAPFGFPPVFGSFATFNPVAMFAAYTVASYDEEIATVKKWFAQRLAFLDSHWLAVKND